MLCYIHIPFCASKCGYCGFNSLTNMLNFKEKYLDSLCVDLENEINNLFLGMQFRTCENFGESTDSSLVLSPKFSQTQKPHRHYFDCDSLHESTTNQAQQTIEGIAVEVAEFLPNFQGNFVLSDETRLGVCEHSKFGKSMQDAPKSELPTKNKFAKFHSIYIGGGTPNTLTPKDFERIFKILESRIAPNTEITMELNPNASPKETLIAFKDLGINRFSIGVQSFCADKLQLLERNHSPKIARQFIENALNCGVQVSIDLIYDTILDSQKSLRFELENALNLGVGHISCYALSIDKNSAFYAKGKNPVRENSLCYDLKEILESRGFRQYEVSNFALNHKSAHNLGYWAYRDYIGVGLGAVGKITSENGIYRTYKNSDFGAYLANPSAFRRESLSQSDIRLEKIFLGLRSEVGVESALIADKNRLDLLVKSGKVFAKQNRIFAKNYFLADELALWVNR